MIFDYFFRFLLRNISVLHIFTIISVINLNSYTGVCFCHIVSEQIISKENEKNNEKEVQDTKDPTKTGVIDKIFGKRIVKKKRNKINPTS